MELLSTLAAGAHCVTELNNSAWITAAKSSIDDLAKADATTGRVSRERWEHLWKDVVKTGANATFLSQSSSFTDAILDAASSAFSPKKDKQPDDVAAAALEAPATRDPIGKARSSAVVEVPKLVSLSNLRKKNIHVAMAQL